LVCPHAVIRAKTVAPADLAEAPEGFVHVPAKFFKELPGQEYTIHVSSQDCTGCGICVETCPAHDKANVSRKAINMTPKSAAPDYWDYFLSLPEEPPALEFKTVKDVQFLTPLFEFSGACAGCGETPYLKLLSQLFGERALIANATGCSSIYGGNLPTTPWSQNQAGRGPAWSNSLFEDNAEFGLGMRLSLDQQREQAQSLLAEHKREIGFELINPDYQQIEKLKAKLSQIDTPWACELKAIADSLIEKSVWIVGGDGWAYDIGFGGLDHVLAGGANVNILVLDT
jgi:pyruvate-ferredoxin/flavodoxin oxidoreductase